MDEMKKIEKIEEIIETLAEGKSGARRVLKEFFEILSREEALEVLRKLEGQQIRGRDILYLPDLYQGNYANIVAAILNGTAIKRIKKQKEKIM